MRISDALEEFLLQLEANGRSPHTIAQYRRHVLALAAWLAPGADLSVIDRHAVARFLSSPQGRARPDGKPKKATSTNALRGSLKGFFAYCATAGLVERDPARLVQRARCGPPPPKALSDQDQRRLLASIEGCGRDHALFTLLLETGIRVGSAVALDVEDVDLERGELWLRRAKGDRPDRVFLGARVRGVLAEHLSERRSGPLFAGRDGLRLTTRHVRRLLACWMERAGIERPVSPHGLRHSFAMALYRRTGDLLLVQAALRHRSIASTLVYTHVAPERLRQAMG